MGITTISAPFQRFFSGSWEIRSVNTAPKNTFQAAAATAPAPRQAGVTADGTANVVRAVPESERGSDEAEHQLGRLADHPEVGGNASAAPPRPRIHWLP